MQEISKKDVKHVAKLAELDIREDELDKFVDQLNIVLKHAGRIKKIDTTDVESTSHVTNIINIFRDDIVKKCISKKDALSNSPKTIEDLFEVPLIIEE
ncbi:MAG: Asp-tRNA(Asn)/Glu-tRNA(Gln) amidotransferase subunit GatC [Candidatus Humimicrobiia bacterium]